MKLKLAFLLALISSAGLIAADAPADAPKGDAKKGDKGKKGAPQKPESVDEATWKKFMEASKAAILKADASLESVFKALEEARAKGKGKGDKGGKKPEAK